MSYLRPGRVPGHSIRWYVYTDDGSRIPRESSMRGSWPGYDADCSCGWSSRTGGAVESYVADLVRDHKREALVASDNRPAPRASISEEENMAGTPDPKPSKTASKSKTKAATSTPRKRSQAASKAEATPETTPEPTPETETTPSQPEPVVELPSRDSTPADLAEQVIARVEETTDAVLDRVASPSGADVRLRINDKTIAYMMVGKRGVSFDVKCESGYERVRVADDSAVAAAAGEIVVALSAVAEEATAAAAS